VSFLGGLFDRGGRQPAPVTPAPAPAAAAPFADRAQQQLAALSVIARQAGSDLNGEAYSRLRRIEDLLRPVIADAAAHPILPEREFAVEAMLTDLVPNTLAAYRRVAAADRAPGSAAEQSLTTQLGMLGESAAEIAAQVKQDAVSALQANAFLLESRLQ
jgi:hypothetical protein